MVTPGTLQTITREIAAPLQLFTHALLTSVECVALRYKRPPILQHHSSNFFGAERLGHLVLSVYRFPSFPVIVC